MIFILNSISVPRCTKRINEFVDNGYQCRVYAFSRKEEKRNECKVPIKIVAEFDNRLSFAKRVPIIIKTLRNILKENKHDKDAIYYVFGLDDALFFRLITRRPFIYEESDLAHTYIGNKMIRKALERMDRKIVKKSLLTVFTSEGFAEYHFGEQSSWPKNIALVPNRLDARIKDHPYTAQKVTSVEKLSIGFVGVIRYKSIYAFAKYVLDKYPNIDIHLYGEVTIKFQETFKELEKYQNCYFHGAFKNPDDMPSIYSSIDLVLSTYDTNFENVLYAEPNKLYEAVYFETPIIVSEGTFLAKKVDRLGIGYAVDAFSGESIDRLIKSLTVESIQSKQDKARELGRDFAINSNQALMERCSKIIGK